MTGGTLTDDELVGVLQEYLTILQGHPPSEEMMERILTPDFETGFVGGHEDGRWRVAAQIVERFGNLNENSKRLFSTPDEGLNG